MVTESRSTTETRPDADRRFSILIADDDRGNRETLAEVLRNKGFDTVTATDGEQAVEIVQVQMIHLVLFDMHMPRLTGLETWQLVRQIIEVEERLEKEPDAPLKRILLAHYSNLYDKLADEMSK